MKQIKRVLISGGAGFVGSSLAREIRRRNSSVEIHLFDNLKRRGGELNLPLFQQENISFYHGDIRHPEDFSVLPGEYDLFIEASAEPSVHSGIKDGLKYLIDTNLNGTIHCLNYARENCEKFIFLSSSRVYSIQALRQLKLDESDTRFQLSEPQEMMGLNNQGIGENFSVENFRSLYGTSKLCSELMIQEYAHNFGLKAVVNRCGVIAGAGQWGKADQGVYTLWVAKHFFNQSLSYTGFGGKGKQVRDILHPTDLLNLIELQYACAKNWQGDIFNIGGGLENSTSLLEYSQLCQEVTGVSLNIKSIEETAKVDIPYYVAANTRAKKEYSWKPLVKNQEVVNEIFNWIKENQHILKPFFKG